MRPIREIIVHCAATAPDWRKDDPISEKVGAIRQWHKDRGWRDIGYHFVIDRDGTVAEGRPLSQVGAHVKGHNTGTIGICLLGGKGSNERDRFAEHFTAEQDVKLRDLIGRLKKQFPIKKISGHNEYAAKACPGFQVRDWYTGTPEPVLDVPDDRPVPQPPEEQMGFLPLVIAAVVAALLGVGVWIRKRFWK